MVEQEPMRDFGSKLADYEASDDPVMDLNSLESERTQFLRQNDDTEVTDVAEEGDDDDAVRCIPKVMQVSSSTLFWSESQSFLIGSSFWCECVREND